MLNPSNGISFLRAPLALLFTIDNGLLRVVVILLAIITDCLDGYLARRFQYSSQFGAVLDPIMDKFFVYFVLGILLFEKTITPAQLCMIVARDFALFFFAIYLLAAKIWAQFQIRSILSGKISTAAQFATLIALSLQIKIPHLYYYIFPLFAFCVLIELFRLTFNKAKSS